jgi:hypothetical protein
MLMLAEHTSPGKRCVAASGLEFEVTTNTFCLFEMCPKCKGSKEGLGSENLLRLILSRRRALAGARRSDQPSTCSCSSIHPKSSRAWATRALKVVTLRSLVP